jgi:hypothetical protein
MRSDFGSGGNLENLSILASELDPSLSVMPNVQMSKMSKMSLEITHRTL